MSYLAIALKYRPQTFEEVVGQEHICQTLRNGILQGKISHAYLFSGPRGIGKTTTARILAKALNCQEGPTPEPCNKCISCVEISRGSSLDVLEIDAASNRGIDEIRALRENVKFAPAYSRYKIYIIDEAHQITHDAFNALLKTLEEPPRHIIFMLATTQPEKIPGTILSRCQKFAFKLIPQKKILERLKYIASQEKVDIEEEALDMIALRGEGSLRDAQSLLDQVISYAGQRRITVEDTNFVLGVLPFEKLVEISDLICEHKAKEAIWFVDEIGESGYDLHQFIVDLRQHFRNMLLVKVVGKEAKFIQIPERYREALAGKAEKFSNENILRIIDILSDTYEAMKWSEQPRLVIEINLFRLCQPYIPLGEVVERMERLEKSLLAEAGQEKIRDQTKEEREGEPEEVEQPTEEVVKANLGKKDIVETGADIGEIKNHWQEILETVRKKDIPLHACLIEGTPGKVEDNILYILFPKTHTFHRERVEKKSEVVEQAIKAILGKEFKIKCRVSDNIPAQERDRVKKEPVNGASSEDAGPTPEDSEESRSGAGTLVDRVLEIFGGEIIKDGDE